MNPNLDTISQFLLELDKLKLVNRRSYINHGERNENSAEHSWHLALSSWSLARSFDLNLNEEKLLKLALVHDLGEMDAGDTPLYSPERVNAHKKELEGVQRLESMSGNGISDLAEIWKEQEYGDCPEVKFLKVVDRILPFLHNLDSKGKTWRELAVNKSQVLNALTFIQNDFPEIFEWMKDKVEHAVSEGWLPES